ncbi:unnamed protein product [Paramecium sonneborni]|uniref:Uncharacterized protein n=1 Tax=Paramecium sonneborni TaxID=65129 RepID=A0A8S1RFZ5_9CILI|nr:unnamed protein product [Paramecium sonneborni]
MTVNQHQINENIDAFILDEFVKGEQREIDRTKIINFIKQKNIALIITTRRKEELNFIQQPPYIVIVSQLSENIDNVYQDHATISDYNLKIFQSKIQGRFLYLIDNYLTMLKYILSFQLYCNYPSDMDQYTQTLVKEMGLEDFFQGAITGLRTQQGSDVREQQPSSNDIQVYKLPQPIKIPVLQIQMNQNQIN